MKQIEERRYPLKSFYNFTRLRVVTEHGFIVAAYLQYGIWDPCGRYDWETIQSWVSDEKV